MHYNTIKSVATVRARKAPTHKAAPLTKEHKKEKREALEATKEAIDLEVDRWFSSTMAKAEELAERFNKKPRYFLDLFFHGGAHLVRERGTTAWNAFVSKKADELNSGKCSSSLHGKK
jgi:hypothetical protein